MLLLFVLLLFWLLPVLYFMCASKEKDEIKVQTVAQLCKLLYPKVSTIRLVSLAFLISKDFRHHLVSGINQKVCVSENWIISKLTRL